MWDCLCACGNKKTVRGGCLNSGLTKSCGCLALVAREAFKTSNLSHGLRNAPEYRVWHNMKTRCATPSQTSYKHYGARGVKVCPEWEASFTAFYKDMGQKPNPKSTIDRIDVNGDYEPGNCRWVDISVQSLNRRNTKKMEYEGSYVPILTIAKKNGISNDCLYSRLKMGWDKIRAATEPPRKRNR